MPIYEYQTPEGVVEEVRPVAMRDSVPPGWRRIIVPRKFNVCPSGEPLQKDQVLRGFHQVERQIGTSALRRGCPYPIEQVKRIWEKP